MNGFSTIGDFLVVLGEKMKVKVLELSVLVLPVQGGITTDYLGLFKKQIKKLKYNVMLCFLFTYIIFIFDLLLLFLFLFYYFYFYYL